MIHTHCPGRPSLPVGKILCVGRNYADHAREMGAAPPAEPLWFLKPSTSLLPGGGVLLLPSFSREVHHEVEMVVRIGRTCEDLDPEQAETAVDACAVGLDLTARDLQKLAKERGEPWTVAKGFNGSAPLSALAAVERARELADLEIELSRNGRSVQHARTSQMIFALPQLLCHASRRFRLEPGDLLFTGTPAGVGPITCRDHLEARLGALCSLTLRVS